MRTVKWLDVYEMIMQQKKELQDELKRVKLLALKDEKISFESYVKFKIVTEIKLETLDQVLREFDKIETMKGGE